MTCRKLNVFNLNSNKPVYFTELLEIKMEVLSGKEFTELLESYASSSELSYIYEAFRNICSERLVHNFKIRKHKIEFFIIIEIAVRLCDDNPYTVDEIFSQN